METTTIVNCDWCQSTGQIEIHDRIWWCDVCGGKGILEEDIVTRTDEDMDEEEELGMTDVLLRDANTREEAVQWAADMIGEIKKNRVRILALESFVRLYLETYAETDRNPTTVEESIVIAEARRLRDGALPDQG